MNYVPAPQIVIRYTGDVATNGIKTLVYAPSGAGKTTLCATAPNPLFLSVESGLLPIKKLNLPYIQIDTIAMLGAAYTYIATRQDQGKFWTICLDSVSDIAEQILANEMKNNKDPRKAYGEMAQQVMQILRDFRGLNGRHVVFTAKQSRFVDQSTGLTLWGPMMPGQQLDQQLPYMFDEVFQIVVVKDPNNTTGVDPRWIRTGRDNQHEAKDRSGVLAAWEQPNLSLIFEKIMRG